MSEDDAELVRILSVDPAIPESLKDDPFYGRAFRAMKKYAELEGII